jgi:hypothetical protein
VQKAVGAAIRSARPDADDDTPPRHQGSRR